MLYKKSFLLIAICLPVFILGLAGRAGAQCNNASQYPSTSIDLAATNSSGVSTTITTCNYSGEYSVLINAVAGNSYRFTSSVATDFFTIRSGSSAGPVVGSGTQPLIVTPGVSGTLYAHVNSSAACLSDVSCRQTSVQCTSCAGGGCINSTVYPSLNISLNPTNTTGTAQQITTCQFSGEYYSVINAIAGKSYTFSSSVGTDWITVRSGTFNGPIVVQGAGAVVVASATGATLFVHNNSNSSCGTNSTCRVSNVQCTNCLCTNTSQFPSTAVSLATTNGNGTTQTITTCNFASEYAQLTTVQAGSTYEFTSSVGTDYLTLHSGTFNGPVVAQGTQPLIYTAASGADLFLHINTNSSCGTNSTCRITTARCTTCTAAPPACVAAPTAPTNGQTGICPGTSVNLTWGAAAGATSYDVYFGTSATPPLVGNFAGTTYAAGALAAGTYFWQIRPRNAGGAAAGCAIWSFTVGDNVAPTITCPASQTLANTAGQCGRITTYGAVSATDACGAPSITLQSGLASGSFFPVGTNVVVYRATDLAGNSATCAFAITINDTQAPTITCPANQTLNNAPNLCGTTAAYAAPTASDNCSATLSIQAGLPSGSFFPVGTTTVTWRATDPGGNTAQCSFTIKVNDVQAPTLTCPPNKEVQTTGYTCGADGAAVNLGLPTFNDNCGPGGAATNNAPATYNVGVNTVTWTMGDNSGNVATCNQTVTVLDKQLPVIQCPTTVTATADPLNGCEAVVDYAVTAYDNCAGVTLTSNNPPLSSFPLNATQVTVTATDASGNSNSCTFLVNVGRATEVCNDVDDDCDGLTDEADDWGAGEREVALDGAAQDNFGTAVDVAGAYAIVGAEEKDNSGQPIGSAYIFHRLDGDWHELVKLDPAGVESTDGFGKAVAISGIWAAVGASGDDDVADNAGAVYVFRQDDNDPHHWPQFAKLTLPTLQAADNFGWSVALHGDYLVVGATGDDESTADAGAAYVFGRNEGGANNWGLVGKLTAPFGASNDQFGADVDVDANHTIVGAPGDDQYGDNAGAAYVYCGTCNGNSWSTSVKLLAGDGEGGDNFGAAVAVSGGFALVGADQNDDKGLNAGKVYSFYVNQFGTPNSWGQESSILDVNGKAGDNFGAAVAMDGGYAVVGAPGTDFVNNLTNAGKALVYQRQGNGWVVVDQLFDQSQAANDYFGSRVAMDGQNIVVGMPLDNQGAQLDRGAVVFFGGPCSEAADSRVTAPSGADPTGTATIAAFPVPFSDRLTIELRGAFGTTARVSVLNSLGQEVAVVHDGAIVTDQQLTWDAARFEPGIYYVRVQMANGVESKAVTLARR